MFEPRSIEVDRDTSVALWRQIADRLRAGLDNKIVADDGKLPSEKDLASYFGVSMDTVRAAISALAEDGIVRSRQGRGTYVTCDYRLFKEPFEKIQQSGNPIELCDAFATELIATKREAACLEVAEKLKIDEGTRLIRLESVTHHGQTLTSRSTCWLDALRFADLGKLVRYYKNRRHALSECGIKQFKRGDTVVQTRLASADDVREFSLEAGAIVLVTKVQNLESSGMPFHYSVTRFAADKIDLRFDG